MEKLNADSLLENADDVSERLRRIRKIGADSKRNYKDNQDAGRQVYEGRIRT